MVVISYRSVPCLEKSLTFHDGARKALITNESLYDSTFVGSDSESL